MCPICGNHDGKPCTVSEKPNGRLVCSCGKHAWPNAGAFQETCRRMSLTTVRTIHDWTQSH